MGWRIGGCREGEGEEEVLGVFVWGWEAVACFFDGGRGYGCRLWVGFYGGDVTEVWERGECFLGKGCGKAVFGEFVDHGETVGVGGCDDAFAEDAVVGVSVVDDEIGGADCNSSVGIAVWW